MSFEVMGTNSCLATIVIGRVVVHTQNRFVAREIERLVAEGGFSEKTSCGTTMLDGESIAWLVLPSMTDLDKRVHS